MEETFIASEMVQRKIYEFKNNTKLSDEENFNSPKAIKG
jgi:hypothetical protein